MARVEIGSSAGLNLLIGHYGYDLGGVRVGPADAPVVLTPQWSGPAPAPERQDASAGTPQFEAMLPRRPEPFASDPLASFDPLAGRRATPPSTDRPLHGRRHGAAYPGGRPRMRPME